MIKIVILCFMVFITTLDVHRGHALPSPYRGHSHQRHNSYDNNQTRPRRLHPPHYNHRHGLKKSSVMFPSENIYSITIPVDGTQWQCWRNATLTELKPDGKLGRTEYAIVKSEIEKTNTNGVKFNITKIEKVKNSCLWQKYKYRQRDIVRTETTPNERMLFHGSPVADQLINTGFDERYANLNGLFGPGIYFADQSSKSHFYNREKADGTRLLLLCRVTLGKIHVVTTGERWPHAPVGHHSVKGMLQQPEYIVYRGEQAYPEYLITYKTT